MYLAIYGTNTCGARAGPAPWKGNGPPNPYARSRGHPSGCRIHDIILAAWAPAPDSLAQAAGLLRFAFGPGAAADGGANRRTAPLIWMP